MNGQEGLPLRFALVCATLALACTPSAIAQVLEIGPAGVTSITGPAVITADGAVAIIPDRPVAKAISGSRLTLYRYCGHAPNWEQPLRFVEDVQQFLATGA